MRWGDEMDREKVINELVEHIESALAVDSDYVDCVRTDLLQYTVALLKEQEAKTGHWNGPECSCCHAILERTPRFFRYCPYCGAKMDNTEGR